MDKFWLEITKSMRTASFRSNLSIGRMRTKTQHGKIEASRFIRKFYLTCCLQKQETGLGGEMVNLPDPISHILQSSQNHTDFKELWGEWIAQQVPDLLLFPCGFGLDGLCTQAKPCPLARVPQQSPNRCSPPPQERCNPSREFTWRAAQKTRGLHPKPFRSHTLRWNILPTHSSQVPGCLFSGLWRRKIIWKNVFWNKIFFPPRTCSLSSYIFSNSSTENHSENQTFLC